MKEMTKIELIKAGAELNYVLGLKKSHSSDEPGIDLYNSSDDELKRDILYAGNLISKSDKFTPDTCLIIDQIKDEKSKKEMKRSKPSLLLSPSKERVIKEALTRASHLSTTSTINSFELEKEVNTIYEHLKKDLEENEKNEI